MLYGILLVDPTLAAVKQLDGVSRDPLALTPVWAIIDLALLVQRSSPRVPTTRL
jgi:hypothetical protein